MFKGAHAVIIVDKVEQNLEPVVVSDDGTGDDVQIPPLLIPHGVETSLIEATRQAEVIVELNWGAPISNVAQMDLWMSSTSPLTGRFLRDFATVRRLLAGDMQFQPHYHVFSLNASHENRDLHCREDGKLCAEDPDGSGPTTGVTVLQEDMCQLCIHDLSKQTNMEREGLAISSDYCNYIERFMEECPFQGQEPRMFGEDFPRTHEHPSNRLGKSAELCARLTSFEADGGAGSRGLVTHSHADQWVVVHGHAALQARGADELYGFHHTSTAVRDFFL